VVAAAFAACGFSGRNDANLIGTIGEYGYENTTIRIFSDRDKARFSIDVRVDTSQRKLVLQCKHRMSEFDAMLSKVGCCF
jgi:hypothetical protein